METAPRVGLGIMIIRDGKVLLGKRKGSHGAGQYCFPGGHLEYMESYEACALREIEEECGVRVRNLRFLLLANVKEFAPKHYVHIGLVADWAGGEAEVREPEKCKGWDWYPLDAPPEGLFRPTAIMFQALKNRIPYYDADAYDTAVALPEGGTVYDKLIRDRIPEIIRARGTEPELEVAGDEEYARRLGEKLVEEAREFEESGDKAELADVLEVLEAACAHHGFSLDEIRELQKAKAEAKGGFKERLILKKA